MFLVSRQQLCIFDKHMVLKNKNICESRKVQKEKKKETIQLSEETDNELFMRK